MEFREPLSMMNISLPYGLHRKIWERAGEKNQSVSLYVRTIMEEHIKKEEGKKK